MSSANTKSTSNENEIKIKITFPHSKHPDLNPVNRIINPKQILTFIFILNVTSLLTGGLGTWLNASSGSEIESVRVHLHDAFIRNVGN